MSIEQIKEMISNRFDVDIEELDDSVSLIDDLGADSLDMVEFIMEMEEKLEITVDEDDVAELKTVGDIINYIQNL